MVICVNTLVVGNLWSEAVRERWLWKRVKKTSKCWEWTGALSGGGYPETYQSVNGGPRRRFRIHCVMLSRKLGRPIRHGYMACHTCDNRRCVKPDHLYEGTAKDNVRDMLQRGRIKLVIRSGDLAPHRILNSAQVRELRNLYTYRVAEITKQLATHFGVAVPTVQQIIRGTSWREEK